MILLPFSDMAESKACRSTPFAKPLTITCFFNTAFRAIVSVNVSDLESAFLEPTIAMVGFCKRLLFPLVYITIGELYFRLCFNNWGYSVLVIGRIFYP